MLRLDRSSRAALAAGAFAAFAGAFVATPMIAGGTAPGLVVDRALPASVAAPDAFAPVVPHRDPFADDAPARGPVRLVTPSPPPVPVIPAALRPLPPNAGAIGGPPPSTSAQPHVTAVVTGPRPFALVDDAGTARLVTVGDSAGGRRIVAITAEGIRLAGGTTLTVAPFASAAGGRR